MNSNSAFVRKIIYISIAGMLVIPLSLISLPATRATTDAGGAAAPGNPGGKLARLRDKYDLSQAKLMEIDPASETMKLASVGLRGVAVNMLWMQAMEHKKKENWDKLRSTLNALIKIQPNFIKVWEYQAHNLSYNISVEFDDYEYRYHWVKEGIKFLTEGIPYNYRNHRITDNLGFFCGMKIGRSDEKLQFRRLFRKDADFHEVLRLNGKGVEPDLYDTREYGYDNWKLAYQWYDASRRLVEKYSEQYLSDMMFYRKRPMQLMNQARGLQKEFESDEIMQEIWRDANREWKEFGKREIRSSTGLPVTFSGLSELESQLSQLRDQLDELAPGQRDAMMDDIKATIGLSDVQLAALEIPADERTEEQSLIAAQAEKVVQKRSAGVDMKIADMASPADLAEARRLASRIDEIMQKMQFTDSYSETVNYKYWETRSRTESRDITKEARQAMWRAAEMKRSSVFDDEFVFDPESDSYQVIKKGAIQLFDEAFKKWKVVLDDPDVQSTDLVTGEVVDEIMDAAGEYYDMLRVTGRYWPEDFIFQDFVDARAMFGDDDLPTSQDVADRLNGVSDGDPRTRKLREKEKARREREKALENEAKNDSGNEDRKPNVFAPDERKLNVEAEEEGNQDDPSKVETDDAANNAEDAASNSAPDDSSDSEEDK